MAQSTPQFQPNTDVISQSLGNEAVLLNLKTEIYYTLDEVGMRMWQLLNEFREEGTVISKILEEYDTDEDTVKADLMRLMSELSKENLINADN